MSTAPDLNELLAEIRKAIGIEAQFRKPISVHRAGRVKFSSGAAIEICGFFETWLTTEGKFRRSVNTVGNLHFDCVFDIDYDASWEMSHPVDVPHLMKRPDWEDRMSELYRYGYYSN